MTILVFTEIKTGIQKAFGNEEAQFDFVMYYKNKYYNKFGTFPIEGKEYYRTITYAKGLTIKEAIANYEATNIPN